MSEDIVQRLIRNPGEIFNLKKEEEDIADQETNHNSFNALLKSLLDPIANKYSILDEIYIDGLDATQVFGQAKIVLDGVGQQLMGTDIPELKGKYGSFEDEEDDDEEEEDEDEDVEGQYENEEDADVQTLVDEEDEVNVEEEDDDEDEEDQESNEEVDEEQEEEESDADTNVASEPEIEEEEFDINNHKKDAFGLNDGFFDIDEYNKQVLALEDQANNQQDDDDEEEIDYFGNLSGGEDDEDEEVDYYDDFYDKPGSNVVIKKNKQDNREEDDDEEEEEFEGEFNEQEYDNAMGTAMLDLFEDEEEEELETSKSSENLSSYQKQQQKLQEEIAKLEAELIADKKWTMKGEIAAKDRPQDSLIDESESSNLKFDRTSKPVPIITDEVTETIEDLIRRRIKTEDYNDLPKRLISDVSKYYQSKRDKYELSEQKSSKSLAELYEDEYTKSSTDGGDAETKISDEVQKQHDEITELFSSVTHSLDALSSAHFVPKPHQFKTIEIKVTDAVNMEDAQPLNVTSESQLAPQEIYKIGDGKQKGDGKVLLKSGLSYSKDELSTDEKQRLRRAGKRKRSKDFNKRKERIEAKEAADKANSKDSNNPNKRQKVSAVVDTLSKAKNVTVIDKKGQLRDVKGNLKNSGGAQDSNSFKL